MPLHRAFRRPRSIIRVAKPKHREPAVEAAEAAKPSKQPLRERIQQRIGDPPVDDSLATISWMLRALAVTATDVLESDINDTAKRGEMLKIADRMAKLRDPDRLYQAEEAIRNARTKQAEVRPGPQLTDAPRLDTAAGQVTARRGRPPRRTLS